MKQIKFLKNNARRIKLGGRLFKPYTVGDLPSTFGFKYNEDKDQDGISEWFNYKGLTYVPV